MSKVKRVYVCSRCISRSSRPGKCVNCGFLREPMCVMCGNAKSNCYFVKCPGYDAGHKTGKNAKQKTPKRGKA